MKKPKKPVYETATCIHCKADFQRLARGSRSKRTCDSRKCQTIAKKMAKFGHEKPVTFDGISTGNPTFQWQQGQYHGGYTE